MNSEVVGSNPTRHPNFNADIAQQAEQLLRKQHVVGSTPTLGSTLSIALVAERLKAPDCNSGEHMLHVSSNLTECSTLVFRDLAQPGQRTYLGRRGSRVRISQSLPFSFSM